MHYKFHGLIFLGKKIRGVLIFMAMAAWSRHNLLRSSIPYQHYYSNYKDMRLMVNF